MIIGLRAQCDNLPGLSDAKSIIWFVPFMNCHLFKSILSESIRNLRFRDIKKFIAQPQKSLIVLYSYASANNKGKVNIRILEETIESAKQYILKDVILSDVIDKALAEIEEMVDKSLSCIDTAQKEEKKVKSSDEKTIIPFIKRENRTSIEDKAFQEVFLPIIAMADKTPQIVLNKIKNDQLYPKLSLTLKKDLENFDYIKSLDTYFKSRYIDIEAQRLSNILSVFSARSKMYDLNIQYEYLDLLQSTRRLRNQLYTRYSYRTFLRRASLAYDKPQVYRAMIKHKRDLEIIGLSRKVISRRVLKNCIIDDHNLSMVTDALYDINSSASLVKSYITIKRSGSTETNGKIPIMVET